MQTRWPGRSSVLGADPVPGPRYPEQVQTMIRKKAKIALTTDYDARKVRLEVGFPFMSEPEIREAMGSHHHHRRRAERDRPSGSRYPSLAISISFLYLAHPVSRFPGAELGLRCSVFGPRRRLGTGSRVPGAGYPGPGTRYLAECLAHASKTHTRGLHSPLGGKP